MRQMGENRFTTVIAQTKSAALRVRVVVEMSLCMQLRVGARAAEQIWNCCNFVNFSFAPHFISGSATALAATHCLLIN